MLISAKARLAIAKEIRKLSGKDAWTAVIPVAQACKDDDKTFSILGFCEECGLPYSDGIEIRSLIRQPADA